MQDVEIIPEFIEVYIGQKISYKSEYLFLKNLVTYLSKIEEPAIVLANIEINDHQIDFVSFQEGRLCLWEIKNEKYPIIGGPNGKWCCHSPSGPVTRRNYYSQTLQASYALKDYLTQCSSVDVGYFESRLVFISGIPKGSDVATFSDKKVKIGDKALIDLEVIDRKTGVTAHDIAGLIEREKLERVRALKATMTGNVDSENALIDFSELTRRFLAVSEEDYVPTAYCNDESDTGEAEELLLSLNVPRHVVVLGDSGCGKTMLVQEFARRKIDSGELVLFTEISAYKGNFGDFLRGQLAINGYQKSVDSFIATSRRHGREITLVLDGFNGVDPDREFELVRAAFVIAKRYSWKLVLTNQRLPNKQSKLLEPSVIRIPTPTRHNKISLAKARLKKSDRLQKSALELLETVNTRFEAVLIGELAHEIGEKTSRAALIITYFMKSMESVQESLTFIFKLVEYLEGENTSLIPLLEMNRIIAGDEAKEKILSLLVERGFVVGRKNYYRFRHELIEKAFRAEKLLRELQQADISLCHIDQKLKHHQILPDVIGLIGQRSLLQKVFNLIEQPTFYTQVLDGEMGSLARDFLKSKLKNIYVQLHSEVGELELIEETTSHWGFSFSCRKIKSFYNTQEIALIQALGRHRINPEYFEPINILLAAADVKFSNIWSRTEAAPYIQLALSNKDRVFATLTRTQRSGISILLSQPAIDRERLNEIQLFGLRDYAKKLLENESPPLLQLDYIFAIFKAADQIEFFVEEIERLVDRYWPLTPYHLRLVMLETCQRFWSSSEPSRMRIAALLESLQTNHIFENTGWIEAYRSVGGGDNSSSYLEVARNQVNDILATESSDAYQSAFAFYTARIEHPYCEHYQEVYNELSDEVKKVILERALKGATTHDFFLNLLMLDYLDFLPQVQHNLFLPIIDLPSEDALLSNSIQHNLLAHACLGYALGQEPIQQQGFCSLRSAVSVIGRILYRLNKRPQNSESLLDRSFLSSFPTEELLYVLRRGIDSLSFQGRDIKTSSGHTIKVSLIKYYPTFVREVALRALTLPELVGKIVEFDFKPLDYAFSLLEKVAAMSDILAIVPFAEDPCHGIAAKDAIRSIEERCFNS